MDKAEFAELPNKLDVTQHFDLCNSTLLLFLRGEGNVLFVKDYRGERVISIPIQVRTQYEAQSSYLQHFWHGSQTHLEAWKSEVF